FRVWAPNATRVTVIGAFNEWNDGADTLSPRGDQSGIWEGSASGVKRGDSYKYRITGPGGRYTVDKADPFGAFSEVPPRTASRVWTLEYDWHDAEWMNNRASRNALDAPISIYEVHLGSWRRGEGNRMLSYREIAEPLADYARDIGYTHVE